MALHKKTFTLIEMLIVVVIIGILAAALIPRLQDSQERTYDVNTLNAMKQIGSALIIRKNSNDILPPAGIMTDDFASNGRYPLVPSYLSALPEDTSKRSFEYGVYNATASSSGYIKYDTRCNGVQVTDEPVDRGDKVAVGLYRLVGEHIPFVPFVNTSIPNTDCTQHKKGFAYVALPKIFRGPTEGFALIGGIYSLSNTNRVGVPFINSIIEQRINNTYAHIYFPDDIRDGIVFKNENHDFGPIVASDFPDLGKNTIDSLRKNLCRNVKIAPEAIPDPTKYMLMSGIINTYYDCFVDGRGENRSFLHIEIFE